MVPKRWCPDLGRLHNCQNRWSAALALPAPRRLIAAATISAIVFALTPSHASAQSAACLQLQNQLAAISTGGGRVVGSPRYRQYDDAVKEQRIQINRTEEMARRNGCLGGVLGRRWGGTCGRIFATLDQMNANLANLERERQRYAPRGVHSSESERDSIIRAMNRRGCFSDGGQARTTRAEPRRRSIVEQVFGVRTYGDDGRRSGSFFGPDASIASRYNTFRTLCVRKCDGYYFPISFSTLPERFAYDESICHAMCPGTDVELYFHAMPEQDSEDMISYRTEEPYADMSTAFDYRKKVDPECGCQFASSQFDQITGAVETGFDQPEVATAEPTVAAPVWRVDRSLDPESEVNRASRLSMEAVERLLRAKLPAPPGETVALADRKVRIVGPAFFPVQ